MVVNFLEDFKKNVSYIKFSTKTKDSFFFKQEQIDFAAKILEDFFPKNFFIIDRSGPQINYSGLKAHDNWVIYNLAQSSHSIGSILNIFEITSIIHYFSANEGDKSLLNKKLKKKNGDINNEQFRNNLFELYSAIILEKSGFKIKVDDTTVPDKPIDIIITIEDGNFIVECKTLNETKIEDSIAEIVAFFPISYTQIFEKNKSNYHVFKYLPVSVYWSVKDPKRIDQAKNCLIESMRKYQSDIVSVANGGLTINTPYTQPANIESCALCIEPYKPGLYESYSELLTKYDIGVRFELFFNKVSEGVIPAQNMAIFHSPKEIEERIKSALKEKRDQHSTTTQGNLILFLEYEIYAGMRPTIDLDSIQIDRIKGSMKEDEIICIIYKDSTVAGNIDRKMSIISNNENSTIYKSLKKLNLNPFIVIT